MGNLVKIIHLHENHTAMAGGMEKTTESPNKNHPLDLNVPAIFFDRGLFYSIKLPGLLMATNWM